MDICAINRPSPWCLGGDSQVAAGTSGPYELVPDTESIIADLHHESFLALTAPFPALELAFPRAGGLPLPCQGHEVECVCDTYSIITIYGRISLDSTPFDTMRWRACLPVWWMGLPSGGRWPWTERIQSPTHPDQAGEGRLFSHSAGLSCVLWNGACVTGQASLGTVRLLASLSRETLSPPGGDSNHKRSGERDESGSFPREAPVDLSFAHPTSSSPLLAEKLCCALPCLPAGGTVSSSASKPPPQPPRNLSDPPSLAPPASRASTIPK